MLEMSPAHWQKMLSENPLSKATEVSPGASTTDRLDLSVHRARLVCMFLGLVFSLAMYLMLSDKKEPEMPEQQTSSMTQHEPTTALPENGIIFAKLINIILIILSLAVAFFLVTKLLRAGEDSIGLAVTLLGSVVALLGARFKTLGEGVEKMLSPLTREVVFIMVQVGFIAVLLFGSQSFFDILAVPKVEQALVQTDLVQAQKTLTEAEILDPNAIDVLYEEIFSALNAAVYTGDDERVIRLTRLFLLFADDEKQTALFDRLFPVTCQIAASHSLTLDTHVQILALVDPKKAAEFANDLNDAGVTLYKQPSSNPEICDNVFVDNDFPGQSKRLLDAVRTLDLTLVDPAKRDYRKQSLARYNLGLIVVRSDEIPNAVSRGSDLYLEALALDPYNFRVRYELSRLWLRYADQFDDPQRVLDHAIEIAHRGWAESIGDVYCKNENVLSDPEVADRAWYCFRLLTVEAGSLWGVLSASGHDFPLTQPAGSHGANHLELERQ